MSETYTTGGDAFFSLFPPNRICQCFTPLESHTLDYVDVNLKCGLLSSWVRLELHKTFLPPWLNHTPLAVTGLEPPPVVPGSVNRYRFQVKARPLLQAGERYWLVIYQVKPFVGTPAELLYDWTNATYPRGWMATSNDNGETWHYKYDMDIIFTEFGDPPLIIPQLPPPMSNWAPLGIYIFHCEPTEIIYLTTSVPCHLNCHWTFINPKKHYLSRLIRGVRVPWSTRFSFAPFFTVEQAEPGDTIYHTFTIPDRHIHSTYWFSFHGEVDLKLSPSVGPIFERTPTYNTPWLEGDFEHWFLPDKMPDGWRRYLLTGTTRCPREEDNVREGKYSLRLSALSQDSRIIIQQDFCALHLQGHRVRFHWSWYRWFGSQTSVFIYVPNGISTGITASPYPWWEDRSDWEFDVGTPSGIGYVRLSLSNPWDPSSYSIFDNIFFEIID